MSMTARETRAAFDKNRIREEDLDGMLLVLFWSIPETVEQHPEWPDKLFTPAEVCKFQIDALRLAVKSQHMLRMIYNNSSKLRGLFAKALLSGSYIEAGAITQSAQRVIEERLVGTAIPELDQLSAANRDLPRDKQLKYLQLISKRWVTQRFERGTLTFRMVIERDPYLLLPKWVPEGL